jgi:hypothetical protein
MELTRLQYVTILFYLLAFARLCHELVVHMWDETDGDLGSKTAGWAFLGIE